MTRLLMLLVVTRVLAEGQSIKNIEISSQDEWRSEAIFWLKVLSNNIGKPKIPRSLSLEGYFTNQSHALENLFMAFTKCVNTDKELNTWQYIVSVESKTTEIFQVSFFFI